MLLPRMHEEWHVSNQVKVENKLLLLSMPTFVHECSQVLTPPVQLHAHTTHMNIPSVISPRRSPWTCDYFSAARSRTRRHRHRRSAAHGYYHFHQLPAHRSQLGHAVIAYTSGE